MTRNNVTLRVKASLVRPGTSLAGDTLILSANVANSNPLSGDRLAMVAPPVTSESFQFSDTITIPSLERDSPTRLTFSMSASHGPAAKERIMGTGSVSSDDLIRHADFVAQMREQHLVGPLSLCPLGIPMGGPELDGASLSVSVELVEGAKMREDGAGDARLANVFLSARDILATRGSYTDSFARLMLVLEGEVEHEIGRTELVKDTLSPEYNTYIPFSYSVSAATKPGSQTLVRFEICDPGTPSLSNSKLGANESFTVIGAQQVLLSEVHAQLERGSGGPQGTARVQMALRQKGELQKLLKADAKPKSYGRIFCVMEHVREDPRVAWLVLGAKRLKTNK